MKRTLFLSCGLSGLVALLLTGWGGIRVSTATEGKYSMTCPNGVKVGIKGATAGWNADPDQYQSFIEATVAKQGNTSFITCEYGTGGVKKYALTHIAAGYDCRAIAVGSRDVVCTQKPRAPIKIK